MFTYHVKSWNLGFISDAHGRIELIDQVTSIHPEIEKWFFLGDLVDFECPWYNRNPDVEKWFPQNKDKFIFVKGNHDHVVAKGYIKVEHAFAWELAQFHKTVKVILPDGHDLLLCHSKPTDFWEFVDKDYTEREFVDDFCDKCDDTTLLACVIGHSHNAFKKTFPSTDACLYSVGAIKNGEYLIMDDNGFHFHKLP